MSSESTTNISPVNTLPRPFLLTAGSACLLFAMLFLVLSLGIFDSDLNSWKRPSPGISGEYYAGIPKWLSYNTVSPSRRLPTVPSLERRVAGVDIHIEKFAIAVGFAVVVGVVVGMPVVPFLRKASTVNLAAATGVILLSLTAAAIFGYYTPCENGKQIPESVILLVTVIPMLIIVGSLMHRSLLVSIYSSAFAVLIPWWGIRVGWMLRPPLRNVRIPIVELEIVVNLLVMIGMLAATTCLTVALCRIIRRRRPTVQQH